MIVLVDSWAWVEYFKGSDAGEKAKKYIEGKDVALVSTINIAEVYRWILSFYNEDTAEEKKEVMKKRSFVISVDEDIAVESAKLKHKKGWGLGDSIIYATAQKESAKILSGDPDFKGLNDVIFIGK